MSLDSVVYHSQHSSLSWRSYPQSAPHSGDDGTERGESTAVIVVLGGQDEDVRRTTHMFDQYFAVAYQEK